MQAIKQHLPVICSEQTMQPNKRVSYAPRRARSFDASLAHQARAQRVGLGVHPAEPGYSLCCSSFEKFMYSVIGWRRTHIWNISSLVTGCSLGESPWQREVTIGIRLVRCFRSLKSCRRSFGRRGCCKNANSSHGLSSRVEYGRPIVWQPGVGRGMKFAPSASVNRNRRTTS